MNKTAEEIGRFFAAVEDIADAVTRWNAVRRPALSVTFTKSASSQLSENSGSMWHLVRCRL